MTALASNAPSFDSNYFNYGTGLLVSILLRYPEVGTIKCSQEQQTLVLKFLVTKECPFEQLKKELTEALELFHSIEGRKMNFLSIEKQEREFDIIVVVRDLRTITKSEINLIVEFIKTKSGKGLIIDEGELPEDEIIFQDEVINHMLAALRANGTDKSLTALRENGKVLVYNC